MKCLNRNKQTLYYANYTGKTMQVDSNGYKTGEIVETYSSVQQLRCNINPAGGYDLVKMFGLDAEYTHNIVIEGTNCPINEKSRIWVGIIPNQAEDNHNYIVSRVATGLNSTSLSLKEVTN